MSSLLIVDRTDSDPDGLHSTIYQERKRVYSTASALVDAFQENEVSATQELKGKTLLVEGTIENIGLDIAGLRGRYPARYSARLNIRTT